MTLPCHLAAPMFASILSLFDEWMAYLAATASPPVRRLADAILRARGLRTRREFSLKIGVTEQTIYNWETSRTTPQRLDHFVTLMHEGVPRDMLHPDLPPDDDAIIEWRKQDLRN